MKVMISLDKEGYISGVSVEGKNERRVAKAIRYIQNEFGTPSAHPFPFGLGKIISKEPKKK